MVPADNRVIAGKGMYHKSVRRIRIGSDGQRSILPAMAGAGNQRLIAVRFAAHALGYFAGVQHDAAPL